MNDLNVERANVQKFERVLLSEYSIEYGLHNYINYKKLKKAVEVLSKFTPHEILATNAHEEFFTAVSEQLHRAIDFMRCKEVDVLNIVQKIRACSTQELSTLSPINGCQLIPEVYIQLQLLVRYRKLNFFGLKKLLHKFLSRCAMRSLSLQMLVDDRYDQLFSLVEDTSLDIGSLMEYLISLYAKISQTATTAEEVTILFDKLILRDYRCRPRIVDFTMSTFFRPNKIHCKATERYNIRILTGSVNTRLVHDVEVFLGQKHTGRKTRVVPYENGEIDVRVLENMMGDDVFVIQSTTSTSSSYKRMASCSTSWMELFLLCNALTLDGARRLTAVLPYMSYAASSHGPAIAKMMLTSGIHHIITVDLAEGQAEGYFCNVPVENVWAQKELARCVQRSFVLEETDLNSVVVVSCDSHSVARARAFGDTLSKFCNAAIGLVTAFIPPPPQEPLLVGCCKGKHCVIVDNVIDEGHLLIAVTQLLLKCGAVAVKAVATHGLFSGEDCIDRVARSGLQEVIVTDSVLCDNALAHPEMAKIIRVVPIAPLLAETIERVHLEKTLSCVK